MMKKIFLILSVTLGLLFWKLKTTNPSSEKSLDTITIKSGVSLAKDFEYVGFRYGADLRRPICDLKKRVDLEFQPLVEKICRVQDKASAEDFLSYFRSRKENLKGSLVYELGLFDIPPDENFNQLEKEEFKSKLLNELDDDYSKTFLIKGFSFSDCLLKRDYGYALTFAKNVGNSYFKLLIYQSLKDCLFIHFKESPDWSKLSLKGDELDSYQFQLRDRLKVKMNREFNLKEEELLNREEVREKLTLLDEMSQIFYLQGKYKESLEVIEKYLEIFPDREDSFFLNQKVMVLSRKGKALVKIENIKEASLVLSELIKAQLHFKRLSENYYPDVSLASVLWKLGEKDIVILYLENLASEKLLSRETKDFLVKGLISPDFNLELELYKIRNAKRQNFESYKMETEQIKVFAE